MIIGTGIDMVDLKRIEHIIQHNPKFIQRVLTENEYQAFEQLLDKRKREYLGGRFACKEAFSKAYGTGIGKVALTDIEILAAANGRPIVTRSPFDGIVHVSITHTDEWAVAQIILEKKLPDHTDDVK